MEQLDKYFINLALDKAWSYQGLTYPNPPVGSIITDKNNNYISCGVHENAGLPHAEVNAIKNAYYKLTNDKKIQTLADATKIHEYLYVNHNGIFKDKNIYVTLEPCNHFGKTPPCSKLIEKLGFSKVFIGTLDPNFKASGGFEYLENSGLHVEVGLEENKCKELLTPFRIWQTKPFVFFKLAMSNNGVIDGGIVTCKDSRKEVHKLRDKCDLLVIGGNTVREDRPTLDARLCDGKAPDILIYSKSKVIDKQIPLFNIPNRKVYIEDNFDKVKEYNFVMIEGGEGMLNASKELVDWYLIFRSPHFKNGYSPKISMILEELFSEKIGEDRFTWYKKNV